MKRQLTIKKAGYIIVCWLLVAGAIWLLHSLAPAIDDWLREKQHLSGWFQGLGGVLAIFAAFLIGNQQIRTSRKIEADRRYFETSNKFAPLADFFRDVQQVCISMRETLEKYKVPLSKYESMLKMYKSRLAEINISDYPSPSVAWALTHLPEALAGVIEHSQDYTLAFDESFAEVEKRNPNFFNTLTYAILLTNTGQEACRDAIERSR